MQYNRTSKSKTRQHHKQYKTAHEQHNMIQDRTGQDNNKPSQYNTGTTKPSQAKTRQAMTRQDDTMQYHTRQFKPRQHHKKTQQAKTTQDKTNRDNAIP